MSLVPKVPFSRRLEVCVVPLLYNHKLVISISGCFKFWMLKVLRLSAVNKLFLDRFAFVCPSCSVKYQAAGILLCKGGWRAGSVPPRVQTGASRILNEWKQQGRSASFRRASDQLSA